MTLVLKNNTAPTWDSYRPFMSKILDTFRPQKCFEWGVGTSTKIIAEHESVLSLDSVEHSPDWVDRIKPWPVNALVILEQKEYLYPYVTGRADKYDFIFIDGLMREVCIDSARRMLAEGGIVCVHDAERERYKIAIEKYNHSLFVDDGHTAFLTDSQDTYNRMFQCLS